MFGVLKFLIVYSLLTIFIFTIVKKPPAKHSVKLTWCQNSLLPLVIRQSLGASHFKVVDENKQWIGIFI
jgi:hypothetical protein